MTKHVDTAFERHFSEPPVVTVKADRTHCEACKEPLDPNVMHKCHGNQEYQAPVFSSTEITEKCPRCAGTAQLVIPGPPGAWVGVVYVVVCKDCRTYVYSPDLHKAEAISHWNRIAACGVSGEPSWATWRAALPGDDERANVIKDDLASLKWDAVDLRKVELRHPDLSGYQGACPAVHVDGEVCDLCEGTGTIPPTKPEGAK